MRFICAVALLLGVSCAAAASNQARTVEKSSNFPLALDPDFQFRKTKIYTLSEEVPHTSGQKGLKSGGNNPQDLTSKGAKKSKTVTQEASLNFERSYRLFGAVTAFDQRQRFGQYFDFSGGQSGLRMSPFVLNTSRKSFEPLSRQRR